jgi:hypothetical protein
VKGSRLTPISRFFPERVSRVQSLADEKVVIKTKHGELTLEQLAEVQPGMARLMKEIGERYHVLYYAAKGGNWMLAQHELNQVVSLQKTGATLRPKFAEDLNSFIRNYLNPISEAIRARDWKGFEEAYKKGIEGSNQFHEKYGYGYIRYVLPKNPPEFYDLTSH